MTTTGPHVHHVGGTKAPADRSTCDDAALHSYVTGDALAEARALLARRLEEAREVIRLVSTNPPYDPDHTPSATGLIQPSKNPLLHLQEANILLNDHLDRYKAMVFNGPDSIKLAISGNRLNKISRRLCEAKEWFSSLFQPISELSSMLRNAFSGYGQDTYEQAAAALMVLNDWARTATSISNGTLYPQMALDILESVARDGKVRLALFVCPPVEFAHLFGDRPERYLQTDMHGSVLSRQVKRLRDLFRGLEGAQVVVDLLAIIGDTDEESYLWHGIARPDNLDMAALEVRRQELVKSLHTYLTERMGKDNQPRVLPEGAVKVLRLSAVAHSRRAKDIYEAVVAGPLRYFDPEDLDAEVAKMRELWQPSSYYQGLGQPDHATLAKIVVYKFATYAMQGVLLWERDPNLVLIQTEKPPLLRSGMLNAGRSRDAGISPLTAVDFFQPE